MSFCSLILIFYRGFYFLKGGMSPFYDLFGEFPYWLDSIIFKLLSLISILGSVFLFYSLVNFFIECFKFCKIKINKK
jgi:hypothetical protein